MNESEHISILQEQLMTLRSKCIMLENAAQLKDAELVALKEYVVQEKNKVMNMGEWNLKMAQSDAEIQRLTLLVESLSKNKSDGTKNLILESKLRTQEEEFRNRLRGQEENVRSLRRQVDHANAQLTHTKEEMKKKNELIQSYETQNLDLTRQVTEMHARTLAHQATGTELIKMEQKMKDHWNEKEDTLMAKFRKFKQQFEDRFKLLSTNESKLATMIGKTAENHRALRAHEKDLEKLKFTKRQLVTEIHDLRQQRDLYISLNESRRRNRGEQKIT